MYLFTCFGVVFFDATIGQIIQTALQVMGKIVGIE